MSGQEEARRRQADRCTVPESQRHGLGSLPQPHARLIVIRELDAGALKGPADICHCAIVRRSDLSFKIRNRFCRNLACLGKLGLGPVEKSARSSALGRGKRHFSVT
jgi:hypothetical protein